MSVIDRLHLLGQMNALPTPRHTYRSRVQFEEHMDAQRHGLDAGQSALLNQAVHTIQELTAASSQPSALGEVSARFESADAGGAAIGYDPVGGTSYGAYQIASRPGTMDRFLQYLDQVAPSWAARLRAAGPANTGSTTGGMPTVWKAIAAEAPQRFLQVQRQFIEQTHFEPARQAILERTGIDVAQGPRAVAEALWSTAVQHGPAGASRIFTTALEAIQAKGNPRGLQQPEFARKLLQKVYALRGTDFGSSPASVQSAVQSRLQQEGKWVLAMLQDTPTTA
ncbi:MAG: hypothetical protein WHT64_00695 [Desulfomicrobiaceae bacterium]